MFRVIKPYFYHVKYYFDIFYMIIFYFLTHYYTIILLLGPDPSTKEIV